MPLYVLGFMGMPRRMEHYNIGAWQPYLIVAAAGALLVLIGIVCQVVQLVVSVQQRQENLDLSGDPWNGRTLEWLTASPPAPYNFAVLPQVRDIDAFYDMKLRGVAYRRPDRYHDIYMPRSTGAGVILGGLAFVLGFAIVWHIWWMAIACGVGLWAIIIAARLPATTPSSACPPARWRRSSSNDTRRWPRPRARGPRMTGYFRLRRCRKA